MAASSIRAQNIETAARIAARYSMSPRCGVAAAYRLSRIAYRVYLRAARVNARIISINSEKKKKARVWQHVAPAPWRAAASTPGMA